MLQIEPIHVAFALTGSEAIVGIRVARLTSRVQLFISVDGHLDVTMTYVVFYTKKGMHVRIIAENVTVAV